MTEKLKVKFGLPEKVIFCKKCTISNQKPTTTLETKHDVNQKKTTTFFNEKGIVMHVFGRSIKKQK